MQELLDRLGVGKVGVRYCYCAFDLLLLHSVIAHSYYCYCTLHALLLYTQRIIVIVISMLLHTRSL
jgi:hypothetical protein